MKERQIHWFWTTGVCLLISVNLLWANARPEGRGIIPPDFTSRVQIALRTVGHQLLIEKGDSISTVPVVKQLDEFSFLLPLSQSFNYDTLEPLLTAQLKDLKLEENYLIQILECQTEEVLLGFHYTFEKNNDIACRGRMEQLECSNIYLSFPDMAYYVEKQAKAEANEAFQWKAFGLGTLSLILLFLGYFIFNKRKLPSETNSDFESKELDSSLLSFSESQLNVNNQVVIVNGIQKDLTYRETKLLSLFVSHPNQILERDKIMDKIWGEEGVVVGRSLDVFISRLRKILKADEGLKISNIRGVGYKLEVMKTA